MNKPQIKICFPTKKARPDCHRIIMKVKPSDISYVALIFEAYDYIGVPRTIDRKSGIVEVLAAPDFAEDARKLVGALKNEIAELEVITM